VAKGNNSQNRVLVKGAGSALDNLKHEVASQIGITPPASGYWGDLSSRQCGAVGGNMVKAMIQMAESQLSGTSGSIGGGAKSGDTAGGTNQ
jgi:small acid-soluble spore protein A (major alpha-type SASP)